MPDEPLQTAPSLGLSAAKIRDSDSASPPPVQSVIEVGRASEQEAEKVIPQIGDRKTSILLLGPPSSGKTALLAALHYAVLQKQMEEAEGYKCRISNETSEYKKIFQSFRRTAITGRFTPDSTKVFTLHGLTLRITHPPTGVARLMGSKGKEEECRIEVPDYPGGATSGEEQQGVPLHEGARREIVSRLPNVTGLVLCLPEDGRAGMESRRFVEDIHRLIDDLPSNSRLKFVAFALTKMDAHRQSRGRGRAPAELFTSGRNAWRLVCEGSSSERLEDRLAAHGVGDAFVTNLRGRSQETIQFAAGRTSIFGFSRSLECFNYDPDFGGLLIRHTDDENGSEQLYSPSRVEKEWRPFQVLDPFLFACLGLRPNYQRQPARGFKPVFENL